MTKPDLQQSPTFMRWQSRQKTQNKGFVNHPDENPNDVGFSCLCCKDTGLIRAELIREYGIDEGYGLINPVTGNILTDEADNPIALSAVSETPMQCNRCTAYLTEIATDTGIKTVSKWSSQYVDTSVDHGICQWIHDKEVERLHRQAKHKKDVQGMVNQLKQEAETKVRLQQLAAANAADAPRSNTQSLSRLAESLGVELPPQAEPDRSTATLVLEPLDASIAPVGEPVKPPMDAPLEESEEDPFADIDF